MIDDLLERAAEAAHDAWMAAKVAQGFHAPEKCPGVVDYEPDGRHLRPGPCGKCHKDIRPYADLDEPTRELDRAHVRAVHGVYAERLAAVEAERDNWRALNDESNRLAPCGHRKGIQEYSAVAHDGTAHCPICDARREAAEARAREAALREALRQIEDRAPDEPDDGEERGDLWKDVIESGRIARQALALPADHAALGAALAEARAEGRREGALACAKAAWAVCTGSSAGLTAVDVLAAVERAAREAGAEEPTP